MALPWLVPLYYNTTVLLTWLGHVPHMVDDTTGQQGGAQCDQLVQLLLLEQAWQAGLTLTSVPTTSTSSSSACITSTPTAGMASMANSNFCSYFSYNFYSYSRHGKQG